MSPPGLDDPLDALLRAPFRALLGHAVADFPGGRVVFTTRRGGVSKGPFESLNLGRLSVGAIDDERVLVRENRARVAAMAGLGCDRITQGRQVHGSDVELIGAPPDADDRLIERDGQVTALRGVLPLVLAADCLPIALISPAAVGMLHGGWRGLAAGVVGNGVSYLRKAGADGEIAAAIGPGIGPCCFEVGDEVRAAFADHVDAVRNGRKLDLKAIAREELRRAGVEEVHDVGLCTMCAERSLFFSHRRDDGVTGRQCGVAWRT